jgi:hypothetical protein
MNRKLGGKRGDETSEEELSNFVDMHKILLVWKIIFSFQKGLTAFLLQ